MLLSSAVKWRKRIREEAGSFVSSQDEARSLRTPDVIQIRESDHRTSVVNSSMELRSGDGDWRNTVPQCTAIAVTSEFGETVQLKTQVRPRTAASMFSKLCHSVNILFHVSDCIEIKC